MSATGKRHLVYLGLKSASDEGSFGAVHEIIASSSNPSFSIEKIAKRKQRVLYVRNNMLYAGTISSAGRRAQISAIKFK